MLVLKLRYEAKVNALYEVKLLKKYFSSKEVKLVEKRLWDPQSRAAGGFY